MTSDEAASDEATSAASDGAASDDGLLDLLSSEALFFRSSFTSGALFLQEQLDFRSAFHFQERIAFRIV